MKPRHAVALALAGWLFSLMLSSCGLVRSERSAEDLGSSKSAYETCVRAADNLNQCAKEKAIYDADLDEYEARHKALHRYGASSTTVIQNH
jgi:hypothetical protein